MRIDLAATESYIIGGIVYSSLAAYILFFFNKKDVKASRLLALGLAGVTWYCLIFLMTRWGWVRHLTMIYGYGTPLYYTIPVFFYLYVRHYTDPQDAGRKNYWHYLPALISFVALMPFYFSSYPVKLDLVNQVVANISNIFTVKYGWIPAWWHLVLRPVQAGLYLCFQWRCILQARPDGNNPSLSTARRRWLIWFTLLETLMYTCLASITYYGFRYTILGWEVFTLAHLPYVAGIILYLLIGLCLFLQPEVLYGKARRSLADAPPLPVPPAIAPIHPLQSLPGRDSPQQDMALQPVIHNSPDLSQPKDSSQHQNIIQLQDSSQQQINSFAHLNGCRLDSDMQQDIDSQKDSDMQWDIDPQQDSRPQKDSRPQQESGPQQDSRPQQDAAFSEGELSTYAAAVKEFVSSREIYKRHRLTVFGLASEMGLSPRIVSAVLNKYHKQRFSDYINSCRIEYIIYRIEHTDWRELTLEGLAREAGFSSKSTFFAVFKKHTSLSPTEFVSQRKR